MRIAQLLFLSILCSSLLAQDKISFSSAKEINPKTKDGKDYLQFGMKQADIEDEILKLYQDLLPSLSFNNVIIISDRYYYERDDNYEVLSRLLDADILSNKNGQCRAYRVRVKQQKFYKDYGVFEHDELEGYYPISCEDNR